MPQQRFRFKCTHCGTCCTDTKTLVTLSYYDILRIAQFFDLDLKGCKDILGFYLLKKDFPLERIKQLVLPPARLEEGLAVMGLLKKPDGTCIYYDRGSKRCTIYDIRPMVCRTFPFTFSYKKTIHKTLDFKINIGLTEKGKEYCPGLREEAHPPLLKKRELERLGAETIRQYLHHQVFIDKWNEAVSRGEIAPTVDNLLLTIYQFAENVK